MDTLSFIVVIVATSISAIVTCLNFIMNFLKDRKRKEERAWDAALQMLLACNSPASLPHHAEDVIEEVAYFRDAYHLLRNVNYGSDAEFLVLCEELRSRVEVPHSVSDHFSQ